MDWARYTNPSASELDRDVARIIAEQDRRAAEKAEFSELAWAEFERRGIVVMEMAPHHFTGYKRARISMTHSTYPGVLYQVTRWDDDEPTGHMDASSKKNALSEMWDWAGGKGWRDRWARREKV